MPAQFTPNCPTLTCEQCGKSYRQWPYRAATSRYCSRPCAGIAKRLSDAQRQTAPPCPKCGGPRVVLHRRSGPTAGDAVYRCKPCRLAKEQGWLKAHPEQAAERYRRRYAKDPEKGRALARQWAKANPERHRAQGRVWREANPERRAENDRAWREANPERHAAAARRWQAANPERKRIIDRAHRTVKNAIRSGRLTRATTCEQCGATGIKIEAAHVDYSRPLDVRWLCRPCHRRWDSREPKSISSASREMQPTQASGAQSARPVAGD